MSGQTWEQRIKIEAMKQRAEKLERLINEALEAMEAHRRLMNWRASGARVSPVAADSALYETAQRIRQQLSPEDSA